MSTDKKIIRLITSLDTSVEDQFIGFRIFDKLCEQYNWQGAVFGELDIRYIFNEKAGRDITETELETIYENIDLYDDLCDVAMSHITEVVSKYLNQQEDEND